MYYKHLIINKEPNKPAMIRNTGIAVYKIIKAGIEGSEPEEILQQYPELDGNDLDEVMKYGFSHAKEIETDILTNMEK